MDRTHVVWEPKNVLIVHRFRFVDKERTELSFLKRKREVSYVLGSHVFSGEIDSCNVHVCVFYLSLLISN